MADTDTAPDAPAENDLPSESDRLAAVEGKVGEHEDKLNALHDALGGHTDDGDHGASAFAAHSAQNRASVPPGGANVYKGLGGS